MTHLDERGDKVADADSQRKVEMTGTEARQGLLGKPVLMVLICGLILAFIAWFGSGMFGEAVDNDAATQREQVAPPANDQATPAGQPTEDSTTTQPAPVDQNPNPQNGSGG